jgi:hypothetical protein
MTNKIEIYQNNTLTISCNVLGVNVTGFTPIFTVKKNMSDTSTLIERTGTIVDTSTISFHITSSDTSLATVAYPYDITIEKVDSSTGELIIHTIMKDIFEVKDGVRY